MQKPLPLSVCIVSGAEEHRIGRALDSVAGWAGEIVVVLNTEVTDRTEEIARTYGAKVFRERWKGFVGQKNSASEKVTQAWLLNIDADECVSPPLAAEIAGVIGSEGSTHAAYEFPRCTFYCGRWIRHGDWYPDRVCRLWQRGKARWAGIEPHAYLKVEGSKGRLSADLLHFSNESIAAQIGKIAPYHRDLVGRLVKEGRPAGIFELGLRPWWRFLRGYLFRLGFLDGWQGYYIARLSAFSTLTRYAMVREAQQKEASADARADR